MNSSRRSATLRRALAGAGAALVLAASALGVGAYDLLKPTPAVTSPVVAVPLTVNTQVSDLQSDTPEDSSDVAVVSSTSSPAVYEITSAESTASFIVDEVLGGSPKTVVGTTDQVAGQIAFDLTDPTQAQLGTILIDARTLTTDDEGRNRALGNQILNSDAYEYITFTPAEVTGLPRDAQVDQSFTFQVTGDLTIKDTTRPATFEVTVTPSADGTLDGTASSTIRYADWNVSIPSVPFVASVDENVVLQLDFTAALV
jgi:polyisoprenoid-binding protein YceI